MPNPKSRHRQNSPLDDPEYGKGLLSKMAYIMRFE